MRRLISMREALETPEVFGGILPGDTWLNWRIVLIASQGEALTAEEREVYRELTGGREREPDAPVKELIAVCGRRAGKTRAMAVAAAYLARWVDYTGDFAPGQRGRLPVIAAAKDTAGECFRYVLGVFQESPACREFLDGDPIADTIRLVNRVDVQVMTASFRTTRGPTPVAAVCDEVAFWFSDGANPDSEVMRALRPGLATLGGPLLVLSSPYAQRGFLWDRYKAHFGKDGDPRYLVIQAPTSLMHASPTLEAEEERAYDDDPASAAAEWGAQFRTDVAAFVAREVIEAVVPRGVFERAPISGVVYHGFTDPSGGASDSMTLAIVHREGNRIVLDAVRERKAPFSPESVVSEFAGVLKSYEIKTVVGDRYAGEWPREAFRRHKIEYSPSEQSKSELYIDLLPKLNSGEVELLDISVLEKQLLGLERRTARGGRDSIDHAPKAHDDVANAVAGAISLAKLEERRKIVFTSEMVDQLKQIKRPGRPAHQLFARRRF